MVKIYDQTGKLLWSKNMTTNPLAELGTNVTYNAKLDIPIPPDANINIYPDKYNYRSGEKGRVTIDVDNGGVTIGYTSYYLLIPPGVSYNSVLDGPEPYGVVNLDDDECWIVPEYGIVCGPGTLLLWQAVHLSGYKKQVVVSVTYNNPGQFKFEAGDAVVDVIIGWGDSSSDSFTVTVS